MAKTNMRLVDAESGSPPPRSGEGQALADAIARFNTATARLADVQQAIERERDKLYGAGGASRAVDAAEAALKEVKVGEDRVLARLALGETDADAPLKTAKARLSEAKSTRDHLQQTIAALEAERASTERELSASTSRREDALREVVKASPEVRQLLADFKVAQRTYENLRSALEFLDPLYVPEKFWRSGEDRELPGAAQWQQALERLRVSADAEISVS